MFRQPLRRGFNQLLCFAFHAAMNSSGSRLMKFKCGQQFRQRLRSGFNQLPIVFEKLLDQLTQFFCFQYYHMYEERQKLRHMRSTFRGIYSIEDTTSFYNEFHKEWKVRLYIFLFIQICVFKMNTGMLLNLRQRRKMLFSIYLSFILKTRLVMLV